MKIENDDYRRLTKKIENLATKIEKEQNCKREENELKNI